MRLLAFLEALVSVGFWSSSPPLVKLSLVEVGPFELAGLRYSGAFLCLLPLLILRSRDVIRTLTPWEWGRLLIMGVITFPVGNGLIFWGQRTLAATTSSFLLISIPLFTLFLGVIWLRERPKGIQWLGIAIALLGSLIFFGWRFDMSDALAVGATLVGSAALATRGTMAREFARVGKVDSLVLSGVPLGIGGALLLIIAPVDVMPASRVLGIVAWLAVFNTALAHVVWNHALRWLKAFEISFVASLMPMGTALLAPVLLGEEVTSSAWAGIVVSVIGVILVSIGGGRDKSDLSSGVSPHA